MTYAGLGFFIVALAGLASLACLAFWIWMLVDCVQEETDEGNTRLVWAIVIAVTSVPGALIYLFLRKLPRTRATA